MKIKIYFPALVGASILFCFNAGAMRPVDPPMSPMGPRPVGPPAPGGIPQQNPDLALANILIAELGRSVLSDHYFVETERRLIDLIHANKVVHTHPITQERSLIIHPHWHEVCNSFHTIKGMLEKKDDLKIWHRNFELLINTPIYEPEEIQGLPLGRLYEVMNHLQFHSTLMHGLIQSAPLPHESKLLFGPNHLLYVRGYDCIQKLEERLQLTWGTIDEMVQRHFRLLTHYNAVDAREWLFTCV